METRILIRGLAGVLLAIALLAVAYFAAVAAPSGCREKCYEAEDRCIEGCTPADQSCMARCAEQKARCIERCG